MPPALGSSPRRAATVPFVTITHVWTVVMYEFYGASLVTRPSGVTYEPWVFASVFVVPGIGLVGHVFKQAIHGEGPRGVRHGREPGVRPGS